MKKLAYSDPKMMLSIFNEDDIIRTSPVEEETDEGVNLPWDEFDN